MTKIDIISGFLGAGKTTLIQKLIKEVYAGKKVVLVENEFGEIGIDGGFLQEAGIIINEINSGCICCTLQGDFRVALQKVAATYQPDHIVIEPSGVGKLSDILSIVKSVDGLELNSYSTVVDAKRCLMYHKNFKEFFDDQIVSAACIILSRTQLIDDETLQADLDMIRSLNADARVITTPWEDLSGKSILEAMEGSSNGFPDGLEDLQYEESECCCHHHEHDHKEGECCCHHHEHDHEEGECCCHHHEHDHEEGECCCHHHEHIHNEEAAANDGLSEGNRIHIGSDDEHTHHHHHHGHDADEIFTSIGIETINKYSEESIRNALSQLDEHIIRAKGIVPSTDGSWLFFDYVPQDIDIRKGSPAYTGLITVIGDQVDINQIKEIFMVK